MLEGDNVKVNEIELILSGNEKKSILDFLQGSVYCWCKNKQDQEFAFKDLMGGDNYYWEGTPLIVLYDKALEINSKDPVNTAAIAAGWLLKKVLKDDKRKFSTKKGQDRRYYRWIREENK